MESVSEVPVRGQRALASRTPRADAYTPRALRSGACRQQSARHDRERILLVMSRQVARRRPQDAKRHAGCRKSSFEDVIGVLVGEENLRSNSGSRHWARSSRPSFACRQSECVACPELTIAAEVAIRRPQPAHIVVAATRRDPNVRNCSARRARLFRRAREHRPNSRSSPRPPRLPIAGGALPAVLILVILVDDRWQRELESFPKERAVYPRRLAPVRTATVGPISFARAAADGNTNAAAERRQAEHVLP